MTTVLIVDDQALVRVGPDQPSGYAARRASITC